MYVLTIDVNGKVGQEKIARLKKIHETPQDPVVVVYTDTKLPDGYTISKFDGLIKHFVASEPKYAEDKNVKKPCMSRTNDYLRKSSLTNERSN